MNSFEFSSAWQKSTNVAARAAFVRIREIEGLKHRIAQITLDEHVHAAAVSLGFLLLRFPVQVPRSRPANARWQRRENARTSRLEIQFPAGEQHGVASD